MDKRKIIIGIVIGVGVLWFGISHAKKSSSEVNKEIKVQFGDIERLVNALGIVQPQNRLEIKPPIGGRIEEILVKEGQHVKAGEVLAIMSSTERAALLDAALLQGGERIQEWKDVYKPTPLLAPIDADVIVKSANAGQTVTTSDAVIVLSDRLIVQGQIDETDVGRIKVGQKAVIGLDAYPSIKVNGVVDHIYYESQTVNNVTIYKVDILPETVPDVFRSGMSANVDIIEDKKEHILVLPKEAVKQKEGRSFVFVPEGKGKHRRQDVETGISDEMNIEIVNGLREGDEVVIVNHASKQFNRNRSSSPFMPSAPSKNR